MSDFEKRLGEALSAGAEDAPGSTMGLVAGARRRSRARRRTAIAGVAAAVALAVVVPLSVVGLGGSGSSVPVTDRVTDPNVGEVADTKTTRTETWRNVTLEVPADWEYGSLGAWCANRDLSTPVVQRPGTRTFLIRCTPAKGYGLTFVYAGTLSGVPDPTGEVAAMTDRDGLKGWTASILEAGVIVKVSAARRETVEEIVGSVRVLEDGGTDPNGCRARDIGAPPTTEPGQMSICRYTPDGWLEQSERLSEADTVKAVTALNAAPNGAEPLRVSFCPSDPDDPGTVITMRSPDYDAEVVLDKPCTLNTSFRSESDGYRKLTRDVMYWALSPGWSGSLASGVPTPRPLRQLVAPEPDPTADDLQTIEYDGVVADVPQDWTLFDGQDCEFPVVRAGPPGTDPCDPQTAPLSFYGEANFDASTAPGELVNRDDSSLASGYVIAGSYAVYLNETEGDLARRILGSARKANEEAPDVSQGWRTSNYGGGSVEVPRSWVDLPPDASCEDLRVAPFVIRPAVPLQIDCPLIARVGVAVLAGLRQYKNLEPLPNSTWIGTKADPGGGSDFVQVVAPTQALAQLILASVVAE